VRRALLAAVGVFGALLASGSATAQIDRGILEAMVGPWTVLPTDGRPGCQIDLKIESIGDGMAAVPGPTCKLSLPAMAKVVGWKLDDGETQLVDARGKPQIRFIEDETALLSSPDLIAPKFYLIPRIIGYDHLPPASELAGAWSIGQHGRRPCQITLGPVKRTRDGESGVVMASDACGPKSVAAKLTSWSREDLKVMLWGPDDLMLVFSPAGKARYTAQPGKWSLTR